ncbi:hypothetical protein ACRALDRAFT_208935 [Sodiomyces alcalophilus JCM 7366]|uniref:uncharacterized protein n=1 Tax=Sodiomyces alcalophilus JCM 7366 TaxID=591952 RepID=UPI0039B423DE
MTLNRSLRRVCHSAPAIFVPLSLGLGLFSTARPRSDPRVFPSQGFDVVDSKQVVEEEGIPEYDAHHFYPVFLGEIFHGRYQTVSKLGYGSSSTIWLARDLQYVVVSLKMYIHSCLQHRELPFYEHLDTILPSAHVGAGNVRKLLDSFEVVGPHGTHMALVLQASQMSLRDMDTVFMKGHGFEEEFAKGAINELLEAAIIHSPLLSQQHLLNKNPIDIHPGNLLLGIDDDSHFKGMEDAEFSSPAPRKEVAGRTIYFSRLMRPKVGPLLLSDFGEARLGPGPHAGDIMPIMYRAPETLLHMQWSYPVEQHHNFSKAIPGAEQIQAWDLLEGKTMFSARKDDGSFSDGVHFSELIAALGPPPPGLLSRHRERALEYWDQDGCTDLCLGFVGNWGGFVPIPTAKTLEAAETKLTDKTHFLQFIRRALTWDPSKRPTARELLQDPVTVKISQDEPHALKCISLHEI